MFAYLRTTIKFIRASFELYAVNSDTYKLFTQLTKKKSPQIEFRCANLTILAYTKNGHLSYYENITKCF